MTESQLLLKFKHWLSLMDHQSSTGPDNRCCQNEVPHCCWLLKWDSSSWGSMSTNRCHWGDFAPPMSVSAANMEL